MVSSISLVAFNTLKYYMNKHVPKTSPSSSSQLLHAKASLLNECDFLGVPFYVSLEFFWLFFSFFLLVWFFVLFSQVLIPHRLSKPQFWLNSIKAPLFFCKCLCAFFLEKQSFPLTGTAHPDPPRVLGSSASGEILITPPLQRSHQIPISQSTTINTPYQLHNQKTVLHRFLQPLGSCRSS